uniref:Ig-like domain-containing protein n=1 Tax=Strix occidentalis caurina TaxID=311401 RepID=A0A8D0FMW3_STROC
LPSSTRIFMTTAQEMKDVPPKILLQLRDLTVKYGDTAQFICALENEFFSEFHWAHEGERIECKLVACPAPHMSWFHNNRPVHQDYRKVIRTESEEHTHHASLEVRDVREHDAGSYRVFAVVLECAVSGQPPPAVVWSLNGQNLSASERLRFEEGKNGVYRLHIQGVSVADAGLYCCVAKNVAGTAQTASELTVSERPSLHWKWRSTLSLVAEVVGVPKPGVKWYHNKSLLELGERVRIEKDGDKCVLKITNVQEADGGQYLCHAVNIVGEAPSKVLTHSCKDILIDTHLCRTNFSYSVHIPARNHLKT